MPHATPSRVPLALPAPVLLPLCLAATAALLGGCRLAPAEPPRQSPGSSSPSASSPGDLLSQAWASWQRAQKAPPYKPSPSPKLAQRAPAPLRPAQLARIDLSPGVSPLAFTGALATGSFPAPAFALPAAPAGRVSASADSLWRQALSSMDAGAGSGTASSGGAVASTWSPLQQEMEARQVQAVQSLALRVALQRRTASADRESLLRDDLRDDLERVGRVDLGSLVPALPPRYRLERLTNLRLKLLEALAIPASEQERAQAEITRIENEIRALLREQEIERAELLGRLRREVPARLQAQREADIQRILGQSQQADSSAIAALLSEQKQRVQVDFSAPARLGLPASGALIDSGLGGSGAQQAGFRFNKNQFRTFAAASPSSAAIQTPQVRPQVLAAPSVPVGGIGGDAAPGSTSAPGGAQSARWQALLAKRARAWRAPLREEAPGAAVARAAPSGAE